MSAGVVGVRAPQPAGLPSRTTQPALRLVSLDERALGPVHLAALATRRGRLVVTLMAIFAAVALALMLATSVGAAEPEVEVDHATTVLTGQTLSEVAATQLPTLPIADAVARIQLVNALSTSEVQAGQVLLIPAIP